MFLIILFESLDLNLKFSIIQFVISGCCIDVLNNYNIMVSIFME
jgi:hypothetical protein